MKLQWALSCGEPLVCPECNAPTFPLDLIALAINDEVIGCAACLDSKTGQYRHRSYGAGE